MSVVWKEETAVFVRGRVRVERAALGIVRRQNKVVEEVQDEASPTTLPGEPAEAKDLLLGEGQIFYFIYLFIFFTFNLANRELNKTMNGLASRLAA